MRCRAGVIITTKAPGMPANRRSSGRIRLRTIERDQPQGVPSWILTTRIPSAALPAVRPQTPSQMRKYAKRIR